jgi:hypothetical protein
LFHSTLEQSIMPSPTEHLPRITLSVTFSRPQLARIERMIERYNATRNPITTNPLLDYSQLILAGLITLETLMFDPPKEGEVSVFEAPR